MQNEIKVGEYIRTKLGDIKQITEGFEFVIERHNKSSNNIVKHSPNLIDLIQCGDYVNGKEVIMDLQKSKEWYKSKDDFITCKDYTFEEKEIKEVVTKEQFEFISYKVTKM